MGQGRAVCPREEGGQEALLHRAPPPAVTPGSVTLVWAGEEEPPKLSDPELARAETPHSSWAARPVLTRSPGGARAPQSRPPRSSTLLAVPLPLGRGQVREATASWATMALQPGS